MIIDNKYNLGDVVYLATDPDQYARIVTSILIEGNRSILYELSLSQNVSRHYDFEITTDKNVLKSVI